MKTIQQLLELYKNPFYVFTNEEQEVLDDFLLKKQVTTLKRLRKTKSNDLLDKTRVTVRNVVKKVNTYAPEAHEMTGEDV